MKPTKKVKKNSLEMRIKELETKVALLEMQKIQIIPYPIYPQNPQIPPWNPLNPPYIVTC